MAKHLLLRWAIPTLAMIPALLGSFSSRAQTVSQYQFTSTLGTYQTLTPDSIIDAGNFDDDRYMNVRIGFDFPYSSSIVKSLSISSNGFVKLGPGNLFSNGYQGGYQGTIFTSAQDDNIVAVLDGDLVGHPNARLSIARNGVSPNRTFTIEWRNVRRFGNGPNPYALRDSMDVHLTLREDGQIAITYGRMKGASFNPLGVQVGLKGTGITNVLALTGQNFFNVSTTTVPTASIHIDSLGLPPFGLTYTFTTAPPSDFDARAISAAFAGNLRSGCQLSTQEPVTVGIRNQGMVPITQLEVGLVVDGVPVLPQDVLLPAPLLQNQITQVVLSGINGADLSTLGVHTIKAYVAMIGDTIQVNDTVATSFRLRQPAQIPGLAPVASLAESDAAGWIQTATGLLAPGDSTPRVWNQEQFDYPNTITLFVGGVAAGRNLWLYRPGLKATVPTAMRFKLAVSDANGNAPSPSLGDDTLKVMYSDDCERTWKTLERFDMFDRISGRISNQLQTFVVPFATTGGTYSIGFQYKDNNTASPVAYRWHIDDIEFVDTASAANDLAATKLYINGDPLSGCRLTSTELVFLQVRNNGLHNVGEVNATLQVDATVGPTFTMPLSPALAPGTSTVITIPGANLSQFGGHLLKAYVSTDADNIHVNDTATVFLNLRPPTTVPGPTPVIDLEDAALKGWVRTGGGLWAPHDSTDQFGPVDDWYDSQITLEGSFFCNVTNFQPAGQISWLYQPGVISSGVTGLRFKLAVADQAGNAVTDARVADDTLKVVYSDDCGRTYKTLTRFSAADVASGRINNTLKSFLVAFAQGPGTYSVGFQFKDNNTNLQNNTYRWHLDDLEFISNTNLAADSVLQPSLVASFCPNRPVPISVIVANRGVITQDSITLGYSYEGGPVQTQVFHTHLLADQTDTLTFSPANLPGPGHSGIVRLKVFTINSDDQQPDNDTLSVLTVIPPPQPMPLATYAGFQDILNAGFFQARSADEVPATSVFQASTDFGPTQPTAVFQFTPADLRGTEGWLISPTYKVTVYPMLQFNVAITAGTSGTEPENQISRDSLQVMYRYQCGDWKTIATFSQADTANHMLRNTLDGHLYYPLISVQDTVIQYAFRFLRGGEAAPRSYRWHVNNIAISEIITASKPAVALSGLTLYPNPARNKVTVSFGKKVTGARISITDLSGKSLQHSLASGTEATLDVHALSAGMYRLTVQTSDGTITRPFTVE